MAMDTKDKINQFEQRLASLAKGLGGGLPSDQEIHDITEEKGRAQSLQTKQGESMSGQDEFGAVFQALMSLKKSEDFILNKQEDLIDLKNSNDPDKRFKSVGGKGAVVPEDKKAKVIPAPGSGGKKSKGRPGKRVKPNTKAVSTKVTRVTVTIAKNEDCMDCHGTGTIPTACPSCVTEPIDNTYEEVTKPIGDAPDNTYGEGFDQLTQGSEAAPAPEVMDSLTDGVDESDARETMAELKLSEFTGVFEALAKGGAKWSQRDMIRTGGVPKAAMTATGSDVPAPKTDPGLGTRTIDLGDQPTESVALAQPQPKSTLPTTPKAGGSVVRTTGKIGPTKIDFTGGGQPLQVQENVGGRGNKAPTTPPIPTPAGKTHQKGVPGSQAAVGTKPGFVGQMVNKVKGVLGKSNGKPVPEPAAKLDAHTEQFKAQNDELESKQRAKQAIAEHRKKILGKSLGPVPVKTQEHHLDNGQPLQKTPNSDPFAAIWACLNNNNLDKNCGAAPMSAPNPAIAKSEIPNLLRQLAELAKKEGL